MNSYSKLIWLVPMKDGDIRTYDSKDAAVSAARIFKADGRATGRIYTDTVHAYLRSTPALAIKEDGSVWSKYR